MRNHQADFLKGFAVLVMIQVHLVELFASQTFYDSTFGHLLLFLGGPPAAPVFMAVMGYFLARASQPLKTALRRGGKLILWGFGLNIGLNINLFFHIFNGTYNIDPFPYLFGVDIFFLAGLSVIIIALIKYFLNPGRAYLVALLIVSVLPAIITPPYTNGIGAYLMAYIYSDVWWSYFPLIPWLVYPLAGALFQHYQATLTPLFLRYKALIIGISGLLFVLTINYGITISSDLHRYYHHHILFVAFTLNFMLAWLMVVNWITTRFNNKTTRYIQWLGRNVTRIYVFQWLIIGNLATWLYKSESALDLLYWFALILILSSLLSLWWTNAIKPHFRQ